MARHKVSKLGKSQFVPSEEEEAPGLVVSILTGLMLAFVMGSILFTAGTLYLAFFRLVMSR